jgi:3',5'-cyclic AMP phosphodiesterase CpdA
MIMILDTADDGVLLVRSRNTQMQHDPGKAWVAMLAHRAGVGQHQRESGASLQLLWTRRGWLAAAALMTLSPQAQAAPIHRIVAVGDLHGDFAAWRDIARAARLIDADGRWIGGDTILVQTGDAVDRGSDSLKILNELMRLQTEAPGQVYALVGNHEAMNMTGDLRYVSAGDYATFSDHNSQRRRDDLFDRNKTAIVAAYRAHDPAMGEDAIRQAWFAANPPGSIEHAIAWRPDGRIGRWIAANPAVVLLDGNLFVHGGISPAYVHMPITQINAQVHAALMARSTDPKAIINDPLGPLWYRGLAAPDAATSSEPSPPAPDVAEPPVQDQLTEILTAFGAKRIIIGHTPVLSGVAMRYDGRLIQIDTGITSVYGGKVSYLEILDGVAVPHIVERSPLPAKENTQ